MKNCLNCAHPLENNQKVCTACLTDQQAYQELHYLEHLEKSKNNTQKLNEAAPEYTGIFLYPQTYLFFLTLLILAIAGFMYLVLPFPIVLGFLIICGVLLLILASLITY